MNKYRFNIWVKKEMVIPAYIVLEIESNYSVNYLCNYLINKLSFFNVSIKGLIAYEKNDSLEINLKSADLNLTRECLIGAINQMYIDGNVSMNIKAHMFQYNSGDNKHKECDITLDRIFTNDIEEFTTNMAANLISRELCVDISALYENGSPKTEIILKGFKDEDTIKGILIEELDRLEKLIFHKTNEWTIVTHINRTVNNILNISFLPVTHVHMDDPFSVMLFLKSLFLYSDFNTKITVDHPFIFLEVEPKLRYPNEDIRSIIDLNLRRLDRALDPSFDTDDLFEKSKEILNCCTPMFFRKNICNIFHANTEPILIPRDMLISAVDKISQYMKDRNVIGHFDSNMYEIDSQTYDLSVIQDAEDFLCALNKDLKKKENDCQKDEADHKPEYTEVTIYPVYCGFDKRTHPDFPSDKCKITVPCRYNTDEEEALISFIKTAFPTEKELENSADQIYKGIMGNYVYKVYNGEFSLSIGIETVYGYSIQDLKEVFEEHLQNYKTVYNIKKELSKECQKFTYNFTVEEDPFANMVIYHDNNIAHVFIDYKLSYKTKEYMRDFFGNYYKYISLSCEVHEVPEFVIKMINENKTIKTEIIDIDVDGKNEGE